MEFLKKEEGNVTLIVVAILLFMTTVGLTVLSMTSTDLKTAFNVSWKSKSDAMVEFALEEYRDRLNELFLQEDAYYIEDIDLSLLNTDPFYIVENGEKEVDIEFFDVSFDSSATETDYEYMNSLTSTGDTEGVVLYNNPPVDEEFETRNYADIVGSSSGIISTDAIFNKAYNANEFFISKTVFSTTTGLVQDIRLFQHFPLVESGTDGPLLVAKKEDLEAAMNGVYKLDKFTLNDDVTISAAWDENLNSPRITMAVSVALEGLVHIFTLTPLTDTAFAHFDTVPVSEKILQTEIKSTFDKNINSVVSSLNILAERTSSEHVLISYPIYLPLDTNVNLTRKVEMVVPDLSRTVSSTLFWNEALQTSELFLFSAEDSVNASGDIEYGSKISIYKMNVGIDSSFTKEEEINLDAYGITSVHTLGSDVFWNSSLNDGFVHLFFSTPNETDAEGNYRVFHLETSVFNFDQTEVTEIDAVSKGINNVGRIGVAGITKNDFGEMMVFFEKSFVRVEKVLLENVMPYNIIISSYEDNKSGRIGAKTKIIIHPEIEVTTVMDSNVRYVKSFTVKELVVD